MIFEFLLTVQFAVAQSPPKNVEYVEVIGSEANELLKPNSAHFISNQNLKKQQDTDLNRAIKQVPGVYVREEDGYGLRPNVGIRGTNPDRSKKVNLMEDGVLIGPAPYSAPAAYYTPSLMHLEGLEVFKGVATTIYGPNSVGGTVNFLTPHPAPGFSGFGDVSAGSFDYRKLQARVAYGGEVYSALLQGGFHETTGFKKLPGGGDTGFAQSDFLFKSKVRVKSGENPHFLDFKVGYSNEDSDETYLGQTKKDLYQEPYRRYEASRLDNMKWNHQTYQVSYNAVLSPSSVVSVTGYWHNFDRVWYRLDKFNSTTTIREVLNNPETFADQYGILRGTLDSSVLGAGTGELDVARNERKYFSRGVILQHLWTPGRHDIQWGLRLHEDQIRRNHGLDRYAMTSGRLVRTGTPRIQTEVDRDTSWSQALFVRDEVELGNFRVYGALRFERVETEAREMVSNDAYVDTEFSNRDEFFVPGLGVLYSINSKNSVFAGVNRGYSPVGPGQSDKADPETSTNYEFGFRHASLFFFEAIGFYSDYQNIKGICSFSAGCASATESEEFDGGHAIIYGLESRAKIQPIWGAFKFPLQIGYTFTHAAFENEFLSGTPEWGVGQIEKGSPLPYIPEHQYSASAGAEAGLWESQLRFNWTGRQWDQSAASGRSEVPAYGVVDLNVKYRATKDGFAYLKVDNLLDNEYIVSYRPYGARPGKDRSLLLGFRQGF